MNGSTETLVNLVDGFLRSIITDKDEYEFCDRALEVIDKLNDQYIDKQNAIIEDEDPDDDDYDDDYEGDEEDDYPDDWADEDE